VSPHRAGPRSVLPAIIAATLRVGLRQPRQAFHIRHFAFPRLWSPLASDEGDLPLSKPLKRAILASKPPEICRMSVHEEFTADPVGTAVKYLGVPAANLPSIPQRLWDCRSRKRCLTAPAKVIE